MLQIEFEEMTGVKVTAKEYDVIDAFYMECEADKEEFCKAWVKLNPRRVKKAKETKEIYPKVEDISKRVIRWCKAIGEDIYKFGALSETAHIIPADDCKFLSEFGLYSPRLEEERDVLKKWLKANFKYSF